MELSFYEHFKNNWIKTIDNQWYKQKFKKVYNLDFVEYYKNLKTLNYNNETYLDFMDNLELESDKINISKWLVEAILNYFLDCLIFQEDIRRGGKIQNYNDEKTINDFIEFIEKRTILIQLADAPKFNKESYFHKDGNVKRAKVFMDILEDLKEDIQQIKSNKNKANTSFTKVQKYYKTRQNIEHIKNRLNEINKQYNLKADTKIKKLIEIIIFKAPF